ncbi:receptor-like protein 14 [Ipomoea triloba]|uniref:receptor-like protein 14 n=1 Tax=Ipomoea triloba TaxID=35885 RepID=UPI00125E91AD|nr:receptor-like protein 14 [Ipomoea triloba]
MRSLLIVCVFWCLLIALQWGGHECCVKEEKMALLYIKTFFIKVNNDTTGYTLPAWLDDGNDTNCCTWERVSCNPTTGRVTELTLDNLVYLGGQKQPSLDVSLFGPFEELVNLQLSRNHFNSCLPNQDFEELNHLERLEALNLAENGFGRNNILRSFGALTTLRSLNLSFNNISSNVFLRELSNLTNLETLDLKSNQLNGFLKAQDFTSLKNLKVLDLSANYFEGSIPPAIGNLSALVALSLAQNHLNGTLPNQEFCKLKNLDELDLSLNHLEGVFPPCFRNLTSLRLLDLSTNLFEGEISFIFPSLTSLENVRLSNNNFEGKFSLSFLANHSKAKVVEILNAGNLEVETEDSNWTPEFQLEVLVLSDSNLNQRSHKIPTFLAYQSMLKLLDLSHNNLQGDYPNWVIKNNSDLQILSLRNNSLEGNFDLQLHHNTSILRFDASHNLLFGKLQENEGRMLWQINYLNLSYNLFEGYVPSSFCNMSDLIFLDLSSNHFNGEIAKEMVSGCLRNLDTLILSSNSFHGQIFSSNFNMTKLSALRLEDNKFSGPISNAMSRSYGLEFLDASNNQFSGDLKSWISNMTDLHVLIIRNNSFNGQFPCEIPIHALLDVSHNFLSGPLPSCPIQPSHVLMQSNKFSGSIHEVLLNSSSNLLTLDIRENELSGNLPSVVGAKNLRVLLLGSNQLSGPFPNQLCRLQKLNLIDLSSNHLSGQIPRCISNITFGKSSDYEYFYGGFSFTKHCSLFSTTYGNFLIKDYYLDTVDGTVIEEVTIDFVTKKISYSYKGGILNLMSGLDLSCNNFTGKIPYELGNLSWIHVLNLSHNQIKGSIPKTFSRLRQIESLDLSYNNLTGKVPPELKDLNFLAVFSVAHNNLSGRIPKMKGQFETFDQSSYEGNPYLCGAPLPNNCSQISELPKTSQLTTETKWYEMDMLVFWVAFIVAYIIFFLGVVISLYVNSSWLRRLLEFLDYCYYAR